jgi:hypothetical protein
MFTIAAWPAHTANTSALEGGRTLPPQFEGEVFE